MPRLTQSEIHSDFSSASETWSEYRAQVIAFYDNYPHSELNDHITREFNKKIRDLNQSESLYISPYNAGLRYIGDGVFTVDPLSFNPYFYIDAASSMLGVLESPSLDLNPAVPSTLDIITATRAGTATYTDASGNIQTASPNTVRVDHVDGVPMILVEPAATNLVNYSEAIGSNGFSEVGTTIDSNVTVSPDGTASADLLKETDASGSHFMFEDLTLLSGRAYTISVFAKRNGVDRDLRFGDGGLGWSSGFFATFDLTEGTATGGGTIENIGNDWYRCSVTGTTNATTARIIVYSTLNGASSYQGDGESGIYLWGFQVERSTVATSYIPTSGSAVTRAADLLIIDGSDFTDFYNQSEGTFYQEVSSKIISDTNWYLSVSDNTNNSGMEFTRSAGTHRVAVKGQTEKSFSTAVLGQIHRLAMSHDSSASEFRASVDGVNSNPNPITGVTIPTNLTQLNIGSRYNGWTMIGHIKRVIFWPHYSDNL
mgnify:CR=1 FL=1